jgi:nucleoside-diphosphate-sugar epimerase
MNSITIIGLGWLGAACADYFHRKNFSVKGTKRNVQTTFPFEVLNYQLGDDFPVQALSETVIITIAAKDANLAHFQKLFLELNNPNVTKVVFISTTSVYSKQEGELMEDLDLQSSISDSLHLQTSELLLKTIPNAVVLRLAGLVGPNRHPAKFLSGKTNLPNPNQYVNLVHQLDVIKIIERCVELKFKGILNVCSSKHYTRKEFYTKVCKHAKLALPEFADVDSEKRRLVSNRKSMLALHYQYVYDDLLEYYLSSELSA